MSESKTIKDYILTGITFCALIIPELIKICLFVWYVILFFLMNNIVQNADTSGFGIEQTLLIGFIYLLSPIGAYFFYDKTVIPGLYKAFLEYLSQTESVRKFKPKEEKINGAL